ncbi:hypothetical protein E2C01_020723 [Portunus trituberculatus]|uniref:Uncharacterized protein n=1 Tax=Portunus trituberculatus TaxID=210409 RepID=A0A5B7E0Y0_PORTR|nr:hypothetical protein [Portunus trituberculatus]
MKSKRQRSDLIYPRTAHSPRLVLAAGSAPPRYHRLPPACLTEHKQHRDTHAAHSRRHSEPPR